MAEVFGMLILDIVLYGLIGLCDSLLCMLCVTAYKLLIVVRLMRLTVPQAGMWNMSFRANMASRISGTSSSRCVMC